MNKRQTKRMKRNAAKAPTWLRTIAAADFDPQANRAFRTSQLGSFGAASEVRHIDPSTYASRSASNRRADVETLGEQFVKPHSSGGFRKCAAISEAMPQWLNASAQPASEPFLPTPDSRGAQQ